ncbi:MAG: hypothetical protein EHM45_12775 [Desulfobacteraceae bacterium]|nr:MAG: hypothetical protein EHM45_12775 [Desulfobacteraceae bacterium]
MKHFSKGPINNQKLAECENGNILLRITGTIGEYCLSKDQAEAIYRDLETALRDLHEKENLQ